MILSAVALVVGWRLFWFLTDDPFIAYTNYLRGESRCRLA